MEMHPNRYNDQKSSSLINSSIYAKEFAKHFSEENMNSSINTEYIATNIYFAKSGNGNASGVVGGGGMLVTPKIEN